MELAADGIGDTERLVVSVLQYNKETEDMSVIRRFLMLELSEIRTRSHTEGDMNQYEMDQFKRPIVCAFTHTGVCISQCFTEKLGAESIRIAHRAFYVSQTYSEESRNSMSNSIIDCVKQMNNLSGDQVVLSIPSTEIRYWGIDLGDDWSGDDHSELRSRVANELNERKETLCVDSYPLNSSKSKRVAVIAQRSKVEWYDQVIRDAGLKPVGMDTNAGAIARCIAESPGSGPMLAIELASGMMTCILCKAGVPVFVCSNNHVNPPDNDGSKHDASSEVHIDPNTEQVARMVKSFLHYVDQNYGNALIPTHGVIVSDWESVNLSRIIETQVGIQMRPLVDSLRSDVSQLTNRLPKDTSIESALVSIGLSRYFDIPDVRRAA